MRVPGQHADGEWLAGGYALKSPDPAHSWNIAVEVLLFCPCLALTRSRPTRPVDCMRYPLSIECQYLELEFIVNHDRRLWASLCLVERPLGPVHVTVRDSSEIHFQRSTSA